MAVKEVWKTIRSISAWRWLLWLTFAILLLAGLFLVLVRPAWIAEIPVPTQVLFWLVSIGELVGLVYLIRLVMRYQDQLKVVTEKSRETDRRVTLAYERLDAIFKVGQKFVEASDEREVIEPVLRLAIDLVGAAGATYVPLDEHGQTLATISQGEMPAPGMDAWMEYLASPEVREACQACKQTGSLQRACPLLHNPAMNARGIFCLPLKRGEHQFGLLNLYLPGDETLSQDTHAFLGAMIDQTALALESVRLRRRELEALRQMQSIREKTDLNALLSGLLQNAYHAIDSDFAVLIASQPGRARLVEGDLPQQSQAFVEAVAQGVMVSGQPVLLGQVSEEFSADRSVRSMIVAPLRAPGGASLGALAVGSLRNQSFSKRQMSLLQTIAGQVSLVVQNSEALAELEYKTIIRERTRLAREIHDGLAQTLGFLKLQAAQIRGYLARGEVNRAQQSLETYSAALAEAYEDVRQAIDGLRIEPAEIGLDGWMEQTADEFRDLTGMQVVYAGTNVTSELPPEIQAQLLRILQEGLANVRKHARAETVWIACHENSGDLWLEIRDDGRGFSPEDVSRPSQHGLRGMRERADLIGADFQVSSRPETGTSIRVRLPMKNLRFQEPSL